MKLLFVLALVFSSSAIFAAPDGAASFARDLAEFRYSLYPALLKADPKQLQEIAFGAEDPVIISLKTFLKANRTRIISYRKSVLERFGSARPELTRYAGKPGFERIPDIMGIIPQGRDSEGMKAVLEMQRVDPAAAVTSLITMAIARRESVQSLSEFSLRNTLAAPRISAVKKSGDLWTVYVDYFDRVFVAEFDAVTGACSLERWLIRI